MTAPISKVGIKLQLQGLCIRPTFSKEVDLSRAVLAGSGLPVNGEGSSATESKTDLLKKIRQGKGISSIQRDIHIIHWVMCITGCYLDRGEVMWDGTLYTPQGWPARLKMFFSREDRAPRELSNDKLNAACD